MLGKLSALVKIIPKDKLGQCSTSRHGIQRGPFRRGVWLLRRHEQSDRSGGRRCHADRRRPAGVPVGFLPPSRWRSPADVTEADTPDNLYCKLPQDSPISVRGARNYPCMGKPGKRAPTVEICNSDKE